MAAWHFWWGTLEAAMDRAVAAVVAGTSVAAAQILGARSSPTPAHPWTAFWYWRLRKPGFTPPGPVFGLAWTGLDALLGYAGYRLLATERRGTMRNTALGFWGLNVLGVGGFSWVLFGRKRLDAATGVAGAMLASSLGAVAAASEVDEPAAWAIAPMVGWLLFATVLQGEVWRRNK